MIRRFSLLVVMGSTLTGSVALAQKITPKPNSARSESSGKSEPKVYYTHEVQTPPEYAQGQYALQQYLQKQVQLPASVKTGQAQGIVQVAFVVQPDGRLKEPYITRGLDAACNAEALRLVKAMPAWRPARLNNEAVPTRMMVSVAFMKPAPKEPASVTVKGNTDLMELSSVEGNREQTEEIVADKVYTYVEQMPEFPGGTEHLHSYVAASLRYPAEAIKNEVEGRAFVRFVVLPTGQISDAQVIKGIGAGCDEEALRVVRALPPFEPGKQNGRTVSVSYTLPVTFNLKTTPGAPNVPIPPLPTLPKPEDKIYTYVERMPSIAGADDHSVSIASALQAAVTLPPEVLNGSSEGQVSINFIVNRDGTTRDAKVVRSLCPACDAAALAAVPKLPRLKPGIQNGLPVNVQMTQAVVLFSPNHIYEAREAATPATFGDTPTALRQYLTDKMKEPSVLTKEKLQGSVEVRFVIQTDGQTGAAEVTRPFCRSCDEEALRLIRTMPRWKPARNAAGQAIQVRQAMSIPMPMPKDTRRPAGS
jgi:TonB family protein